MEASGKLPETHLLYAPGLKWRIRLTGEKVPIWLPRPGDVKAGYAPKSLTLDRYATQAVIAAECRRQWKDLLKWREEQKNGRPKRLTIAWLIDRYLHDDFSPYHRLKPDTRQSYGWECKRIKETIGDRLLTPRYQNGIAIPRIIGEDVLRWYQNWRNPPPKKVEQSDGSITLVPQKPTPSRARHCIEMLRTLLSYNVVIGTDGAQALKSLLSIMRFEAARARVTAPTYEQVKSLVAKAIESGYRSIAITTLAQYELIERRTHIIGQWDGDAWGLGWMWDGQIEIDGRDEWIGVSSNWTIRYYQTKKGPNLREFSLTAVQPLLTLLQETPKEARQGPIIVCEDTGQPWVKRRYQEKFREIARAAGVPDNIYSMDMRAGGATEVDELSEVTDRMFDDAGGWVDPTMKNRYRRKKVRAAQKVVQIRQAARNRG